MADGQERDLIVEIDESLHDDAARAGTSGGLRLVPGVVNVSLTPDGALAVAGRAHHGLHDAGDADLGDGRVELLARIGELVARRGETQLLGSQAADTLPVHRQERGLGGRDDVESLLLQFDQGRRGDGLHLRNDVVGPFGLDDFPKLLPVQHVDDIMAVRHLHSGRIRIAVHRNHFDAEALQFDYDFLTQFS